MASDAEKFKAAGKALEAAKRKLQGKPSINDQLSGLKKGGKK